MLEHRVIELCYAATNNNWEKWLVNGQYDELKSLIQAGANVNAIDEGTGESALWILCGAFGYALVNETWEYECGPIEFLLENGAKPNLRTTIRGETALFEAVDCANGKTVQMLLSYGANPNIRNKDGETPLMIALKRDVCGFEYDVINPLLESRIKPNIKNNKGWDVIKVTVFQQRSSAMAGLKIGRKGCGADDDMCAFAITNLIRKGADIESLYNVGLSIHDRLFDYVENMFVNEVFVDIRKVLLPVLKELGVVELIIEYYVEID